VPPLYQSVTQALRTIARAPDREAIIRLAPRAYLDGVPNEGWTPVAPVLYARRFPWMGVAALEDGRKVGLGWTAMTRS